MATDDPGSWASLVKAVAVLPQSTVVVVVLVAGYLATIYLKKRPQRRTEDVLADSQTSQATAFIRIAEGFLEKSGDAAERQASALDRLAEAVVELRLAVSGNTALLGNMVQAVQAIRDEVDKTNDKCLLCKSHKG